MSRWVQRDENGKVVGHFANAQTYALEELPDDHPELAAFRAAREAGRGTTLKQHVANLEGLIVTLAARIVELERKTSLIP